VKYLPSDPILYTGDQYVSRKPITGKVLEELPNGYYKLRLWISNLSEFREITASIEEFERLPEYIYRWRTESSINSKVYTQKRTASAQATVHARSYGSKEKHWVQRAKVEWEDV
jgi:hypothetical protein